MVPHIKNHIKKAFAATISFLFAAGFVMAYASAAASPLTQWPEINSHTAVVIDARTGFVLFDQRKDERVYPASV
ncbi:MAG: hypothetical protein FWE68_03160, partial [Defluviitaleaceae bacterium]|nr:hypothetical protein [Defluviitaleaceae bacterium]